jgi:hypothetical protein
VTANSSSLPEVAGGAAMLVDPYKPMEIAAALQMLDTDAQLRERLSIAGKAQAAKYAMEPYQKRLSAMYADILGTGRR